MTPNVFHLSTCVCNGSFIRHNVNIESTCFSSRITQNIHRRTQTYEDVIKEASGTFRPNRKSISECCIQLMDRIKYMCTKQCFIYFLPLSILQQNISRGTPRNVSQLKPHFAHKSITIISVFTGKSM